MKKLLLWIVLLPFLPLVILRRWYWGPKDRVKVLVEQNQSDVTYEYQKQDTLEFIKHGEKTEIMPKPQPEGHFWRGTLVEALDDKHLYNIIMACERGTWLTYGTPVVIEASVKTALYAEYNYRKDLGKYDKLSVEAILVANAMWDQKVICAMCSKEICVCSFVDDDGY